MKRSNRLVALTNFFIDHPKVHMQLSSFTNQYGASISSISEDLYIIDKLLKHEGVGYLRRVPGATGGVVYILYLSRENCGSIIHYICMCLYNVMRYILDWNF